MMISGGGPICKQRRFFGIYSSYYTAIYVETQHPHFYR